MFPVIKKNGKLRMVLNAEHMNAVTIRDAGLPPHVNDFVDSHVG